MKLPVATPEKSVKETEVNVQEEIWKFGHGYHATPWSWATQGQSAYHTRPPANILSPCLRYKVYEAFEAVGLRPPPRLQPLPQPT